MFAYAIELLVGAFAFFLVVWIILVVALGFWEGVGMLRAIFDPVTIRRALRGMIRFRLGTLLLAFGVFQLLLGLWLSQSDADHRSPAFLITFGCVIVVVGMIWCCLGDAVRPTVSRKWRRIVSPPKVKLPSEDEDQGPPREE